MSFGVSGYKVIPICGGDRYAGGTSAPYSVHMATREQSARNKVAVEYLRTIWGAKIESERITFPEIATRTGLSLDRVNRLMNNRAELSVRLFVDIAEALGVAPADAFESLGKIARDKSI